ncbi:hypothetical protein [Marinitoga sp. 1155]|uniref:hypothetical protein n=1 Tax=Marinitoga sp. 1155 TaxID=1428448 RepID=UPI000641873D|nr:hypothetical protein [Marinitoga sp. 1155]KLO21719.1 hypothetical protein X274_10090 [Marinitoga sp. 1155]
MLEIKIDKKMIMDLLNKFIKYTSSDFIRKIFNASTKISFKENSIEIKVFFLKYYIKIHKIPFTLSGVYEFEHNLPIYLINKNKLPQNILIDKNKIYIYIKGNFFTQNTYIDTFVFDNDKVIIKLK